MRLDFPNHDEMDKRSPGFRFTKWQSSPENEEVTDKRSPGFRYMTLHDNVERPSRYHRMNLLDALENELATEKRSPGFRSMRIQPNHFKELEDDVTNNDVSKRYFRSGTLIFLARLKIKKNEERH